MSEKPLISRPSNVDWRELQRKGYCKLSIRTIKVISHYLMNKYNHLRKYTVISI